MTTDGARLQHMHVNSGGDGSSAAQAAGRCLKAAASDQRTLLVGGSLLASFVLFQMLRSTPRPAASEPRGADALEPPDPELGAWAE